MADYLREKKGRGEGASGRRFMIVRLSQRFIYRAYKM